MNKIAKFILKEPIIVALSIVIIIFLTEDYSPFLKLGIGIFGLFIVYLLEDKKNYKKRVQRKEATLQKNHTLKK